MAGNSLAEQGPEAGIGSYNGAHQAYNSGILINPDGQIVLHHRQLTISKRKYSPLEKSLRLFF